MAGGALFPKTLRTQQIDGDPIFVDSANNTIDGGDTETLIDFTVAAGKTRTLHTLLLSSRLSGIVNVLIDSQNVMQARTSPGKPDVYVAWFPGRPATAGQQVEVTFQAQPSSLTATVSAYLMIAEK